MIAKEIQLNNEWVDLYAELGVTNDKDVFIQNKSKGSVYIWPKSEVPDNETDGQHLKIGETTVVNSNQESLYVRGLGNVYTAVVTVHAASSTITTINNDESTPVPVKISSFSSTNNSTVAQLLANGTFTGQPDEVSQYGTILVSLRSNVPSANNGILFQASNNQQSWYDLESYSYNQSAGISIYSMAPGGKYFRIKYINGTQGTEGFFINTIYKQGYVKPSSHRVGDNITGENDAELIKAVLAAAMPNGNYTNIHATAGGNLKISLEEIDPGLQRIPVEPLSVPLVARQLAANATTSQSTLTETCKRISIRARNSNIRYVVGVGNLSANSSSSHFIGQDERLDLGVVAGSSIAAIRDSASSVNGILEITELG
jgi:hypothetical protein